jgi:hypothetical protein
MPPPPPPPRSTRQAALEPLTINYLYFIFHIFLCSQVALEPLNPSELPKMLDGLRKARKHTRV